MKRWPLVAALAAGVGSAAGWAGPAVAQDVPQLVIVSPREGSSISPDVRVVVQLRGGEGEVAFSLLLDGDQAAVEGPQGSDTPAVAPGEDATILLSDLPAGSHVLQAVPVSGQARASSSVAFIVESEGLSGQAILIALVLIGLLILYRSRILAPWADRYQPKPKPPTEPEP
jgi:hypothetical protein